MFCYLFFIINMNYIIYIFANAHLFEFSGYDNYIKNLSKRGQIKIRNKWRNSSST